MGTRGATSQENEIEQADKERIAKKADETTAAGDEQRMLATRRETELNRIAGDLPEDINALWMFTEHSMLQEAVSGLDSGRGLLKLKEKLQHGEFVAGLEERGIPARTARRKMAIAVRFADRTEKLIKLGRTKLYACLDFDDGELDTLEDGGSVLDITLDDLDRMTTRELKAKLKKQDADIQVKDQLLEEKNVRLDQVATENAHLRGEISTSDTSPQVQAIRELGMRVLADASMLTRHASRLGDSGRDADTTEVASLSGALHNLRIELALAFDYIEQAAPAFQAQLEGAAVDIHSWKQGMDIPADMVG